MNIYRGKRLRKEYPKDEIKVISNSENEISNNKMDENKMNDEEWYAIEKIYPAYEKDKFKIVVEEVKFKG